jgi:CelD/BcsL family acetyltransferase involved in cellulose biosynthesis
MTQVEVLPIAGNRDEIRAIWCELEAACNPRYWLRWAWIETWLDTLPRELLPQLVVVRADVPIAAFFLRVALAKKHRLLRWRRAHLNEVGDEAYDILHTEYNGWLHRPGRAPELYAVLDRLPFAWDELVMNRLAPDGPPSLERGLGGYRLVEREPSTAPQVSLSAVRSMPDGYLALLGRNTRAAIRRSRRVYGERGPLVLEAADSAREALDYLEGLATLSQQRFAVRRGGAFGHPYFRTFHHALIERRFAMGELELLRLRAGDQTLGYSYNFITDGIVSFYQSGLAYDLDNRLKPGLVLHAEAIERAALAGHRLYDFLEGQSRYKAELSTSSVELRSVRIQQRRPVFYVEEGLDELRSWARRRLQRSRT